MTAVDLERPAPTPPGAAPPPTRDQRHFERSTIYLLANTAATGALGTAFWLVAARLAPEEDVATAVAASSLLIALAFVAQVNLPTAISRFLPNAGATQRSLVRRSYAVAVSVATVFAVGVIAVGEVRGGSVIDGGDRALTLALALSIPVWVLFAMQDGVLIALRRTVVVPIENVASTLAKYALLPVLLGLGGAGILLAWTLPALAAIPLISWLLFRRYLPPDGGHHPDGFRFVRYALQDFPGAALYLLSFRIVPLLVIETGDALDGAYIGLPWTILTVAALALPMLSRSLLAELSHGDTDAPALMRRATRLIGLVVVPASLVGAVLVGPVLAIAGEAYADRGSRVLAFGIIGMAPAALVECQLALLRYRNRVMISGLFQSIRAIALLGGVWTLLVSDRVADIGIVFLVVNIAAAAIAVPLTRSVLTADAVSPIFVAAGLDAPLPYAREASMPAAAPAIQPVRDLTSENDPAALTFDVETVTRDDLVRRSIPGGIGFVLAMWAALRTDIADVGRFGLIQAVGPIHVIGAGLVVLGTVLVAGNHPLRRRLSAIHIAALVMVLHGLPGVAEPHPRFGVAWLHSGFIDQIATDGVLLTRLDARFSWPGFFSANAVIQRLTGTDDTMWLVRFAPVAISVFACVCIGLIGRALGRQPAERTLAMTVFLVFNWSGQDYFAPQATGFSFYLAILAVLLTFFGADPAPGRIRRLLRPEPAQPTPQLPPNTRVLLLAGVAVLALTIVVTHQLTPGFLASVLFLLAVTGTVRARSLHWAVAMGVVVWLAYGAEDYWRSNLGKITGSVGDTSGLVGDNVGDRTAGAVVERQFVLGARVGLALLVWGLATVAIVWAWRRRRTPIALAAMFLGPFPLFLVQPYGGEMLIRVYFFTLPAAGLLVAGLLGSRVTRLRWQIPVGLALAAAVPVFLLARFGNEEYELVTDRDLDVVHFVNATMPDDSTVFVVNRQALLNVDRVGEIRYRSLDTADAAQAIEKIRSEDDVNSFVMLTSSQEAFWEQTQGRPDGWISTFADDLLATGEFELLYREAETNVLRFVGDLDAAGP